jgi:hypothetical protein
MFIPLTYSTMFICSSSIYYCIININIHQCIITNNKHIHTMHSTPIFTWKPNVGENHGILFLYVFKNYIQGSTNFQFSSSNQKEAPTPYILRLQLEGEDTTPQFSGSNQKEAPTPYNHLFSGSNLKEAPTPWFSGSNQKVATTTYPCPVLPP